MIELEKLHTEKSNPASEQIDTVSTLEMTRIINNEDKKVAQAIECILPQIAAAIDLTAPALRAGGRLFYIGAGTSGRLGILDAVECPPTYGTDPQTIQGLIAGGYNAMGEVQIITTEQPSNERTNIAARIIPNELFLIKYITPGRQFRFEFIR